MIDTFSPAGLHLKKVTATELAGPCPFCGQGRDRFHIFLDETGNMRRYWCRQCGESGDGIDLRMKLHDETYAEACRALGITPKSGGAASHKKRPGHTGGEDRHLPPLPGSSLPGEAWRQRATAFLEECQAKLMTPDAIVAIAYKRSIPPERAAEYGIGWHGEDEYQPAAAWGVSGQRSIRVPRGILTATKRPGLGVVALTVRRCEPNLPQHERYWQVKGGARDLAFTVGESGRTTFLVESALDAALIFSETDDRYSAVASCGASKTLDEYAMTFLRQAPILIAVPDNDEAGLKAWESWRATLPEAVCFPPPPGFKDIGDAHQSVFKTSPPPSGAITVRNWLPLAVDFARLRKASFPPLLGERGAA